MLGVLREKGIMNLHVTLLLDQIIYDRIIGFYLCASFGERLGVV